jgi:PAS domain S-box-containing protein
MLPASRSVPLRYGFALLATAIVAALRIQLSNYLGEGVPFIFFFPVVTLTAWYGGLGPGLFSTFLSVAAAAFFLFPPHYSFAVGSLRDVFQIAMFVVGGIFISWICENLRSANVRALGLNDLRERALLAEQSARSEAEDQRKQITGILESMTDGFAAVDADYRFTYVNPRAEELSGRKMEDLFGKTVWEVFPVLQNTEYGQQADRVIEERVPVNFEEYFPRAGRWFAFHLYPSKDGGLVTYFRDITEKKRAAADLRKSRHQIEAILQGVADSITVQDTDGNFIYANDAAAAEFGFQSVHELLQTSVDDLTRRYELLDEEDNPLPNEQLPGSIAVREGRSAVATVRFRSLDTGRERWSIVKATPGFDESGNVQYAINVFSDITERKREEDAQRFLAGASAVIASSLDYESTLKSVAQLAVPVLADWCTVDLLEDDGSLKRLAVAHVDPAKVQRALELEKRYPPDMAAPRGVPNVLRTGRPEILSDISDALLQEAAMDETHLAILRDIGFRSAMILPLVAHNRTLGAISFVISVSSRHYTERDLALAEQLAARAALAIDNARLYRSAQEANRTKDDFLATLSHELRTPLTAILGWSTMLRTGDYGEDAIQRGMEVIERNARAQAQIVDDVLDVSRIITGKLRLDITEVSILPIIAAAIESVEPAANAKGIRINSVFDESVDSVPSDAARLQQIMWNLLSNAVKFSPPGGTIDVTLRRTKSHIEIRVSDTGQGIEPAFLPMVFDRFSQADSSISRKHGGLGLGLSIVRHLVELHGGRVRAESKGLGHGAVFIVELPAAQPFRRSEESGWPGAQGTIPLARQGGPEPGSASALKGKRILVVDDDSDARELLSVIIEMEGAEVSVASSADEAIAVLKGSEFDVLVSDIAMPGKDGFALITELRSVMSANRSQLKTLALTAYAREEDRLKALRAGYHIHLSKPVNPHRLIAALTMLVSTDGRTTS